MGRIRRYFGNHPVASWASTFLLLWKPIELVLAAIGVIDQVRSLMDPSYWFTRLMFWPHLGTVVSVAGLLTLVYRISREPAQVEISSAAIAPPSLQPAQAEPSLETLVADRIFRARMEPPPIAGRDYVAVSVAEILLPYRDHTTADAEVLAAKFKGKWIEVAGVVSDVLPFKKVFSVQLDTRLEPFGGPTVAVWLDKDDSAVTALRKGDRVVAHGAVASTQSGLLVLQPAEIRSRNPRA